MTQNYVLLAPELVLFATAMVVVGVDVLRPQVRVSSAVLGGLAAAGAAGALVVSLAFAGAHEQFGELLVIDHFTTFFRVLFNATVIADGFWTKEQICAGQYADACKAAGIAGVE